MHCFYKYLQNLKLNVFIKIINNLGFTLPFDAISRPLYQKRDPRNNSDVAGSDMTTPDQ